MTSEENKAVICRFYEAFEANDLETLKGLLSPELTAYSHGSPGPQNREMHLQVINAWNASFADTRFSIEEQLADGDKVATRVILRSTHSLGEFQGLPPTGKKIEIGGITIERVKDGKIVERRVSSDWLGMLQQLGLVQQA